MERIVSRIPALFCALTAAIGQVGADELDDRVKAFQEAALPHFRQLQEAAEKAGGNPNPPLPFSVNFFAQKFMHHGGQPSPDPDDIIRQLEIFRNSPGVPAPLKALADALVNDLPKLLEKRTERELAEIDGLVKKTAPACLAAKTESDLDPLLRELSRAAQRSRRGSSAVAERMYRRLQAATHAVSTWQDYLAHLTLGNPTGASEALRQLLQSTEYPIIAREEIEKRLSPATAARDPRNEQLAALKRVQKIQQLESAISVLRTSSMADRTGAEMATLRPFEQLVAGVAAIRAGFVEQAFRVGSANGSSIESSPEWNAEFHRLRGLLLLEVLPPYLDLREIPAPAEGENATEYLLRLTETLVKERRFVDSMRSLETYRTVAFGGSTQAPSWIAADLDGLRAFAAADRLASAGSWAEAISSYRRATEISGKFTPAAEAAQRLAELGQAHPDEAKVAARLSETEAIYRRLSRDITNDATRALESRLPPDIRSRLRPPGVTP